MNLLAFDTATEQLAVAVHAQGRSLGRVVPGGAAASSALLPLAQARASACGLHTRVDSSATQRASAGRQHQRAA